MGAAGTDGSAGLGDFLGDDLRGRLRVEEAVADDLADDLIGAAVVGPGSALVIGQCGNPVLGQGVAELEIALFAVAEGRGGSDGALTEAIAGEEHGEFVEGLVVGGDVQGAVGAAEETSLGVEGEHGVYRRR